MGIFYVSSSGDGSGDGTTTATSGTHGAWTLAQLLSATPSAGDDIRIMADGTYSRSATGTLAFANGTAAAKIVIQGANSSGVVDGTFATIQLTASSLTGLNITGSHIRLRYLDVDCNAQAASTGITVGASYSAAIQCKARNFKTKGINIADSLNQAYVSRCRATAGAGTCGIYVGASSRAFFSESDNSTCHGFQMSANGMAVYCLSGSNTGTSDGFNNASVGYFAVGSIAWFNGRYGFDLTGNSGFGTFLTNCWSFGNTTQDYGTDAVKDGSWLLNCAGRAASAGGASGSGYTTANLLNNEGYVTLTGDPATNGSTGNFASNSTAGAGLALKAAGFPGALPRGTTTGYTDIGIQHQDAGGGGGASPIGSSLIKVGA